ncbi:MAG: hypothetical protein [Cressdnaviricota sp.]|nr:MAG: hypothetical protein [Cressdnaviricota sp.]
MPKYAHQYVRQRELGKKVTRPLRNVYQQAQSQLTPFQYKIYIDSLYDKYQRVYTRYEAHRRAMPRDFTALNNMRHSINDIETELVDLGELKQ